MPAQTGNALQGSRQMEPPSCMRAHSFKPTCTHVAQVGALPRGCPHAGKHSCTHTHITCKCNHMPMTILSEFLHGIWHELWDSSKNKHFTITNLI